MPDSRIHVEPGRILPHGPAGAIAAAAEPLPALDDPAFGSHFDRFGDARVVLLGGSSEGASEFVRARAAITRWLVENRGFGIVALDADWPDARILDAHVRGQRPPAGEAFARFPRWTWRNREFDAFLGWLGEHNHARPRGAQARLHGLDVYGLAGAMGAALDHLDHVDPQAAAVARERYGCLNPWAQDPEAFGRMAVSGRYAACEGAVTSLLTEALRRRLQEIGGEETLTENARSARLLRAADAYYRAMYYGGGEAWNARSAHLFDSLRVLLDAGGPDARAVVWAHNAHAGDARATDMGLVRDEVSLGQLCREALGDEARLVGFGAHGGEVACAAGWGAPMEVRSLRPSLPESQERQSHNAGLDRFLLDLRPGENSRARRALADPRLERFVGPVYRPDTERWSHYAECRLPDQFDAWVWFDETSAVTPLEREGTAWPAHTS